MRVKRAKSLDTKTIKKVTKLLKQQTLSGFNAGTGPSYFGGPYVQKLENKFEFSNEGTIERANKRKNQ